MIPSLVFQYVCTRLHSMGLWFLTQACAYMINAHYFSLLSYGKEFQRGEFKASCLCLNRHNYKEQLHFQRWSVPSCSSGVRAIKPEHYLGAEIQIFFIYFFLLSWVSFKMGVKFYPCFFLQILTIYMPIWVCIIIRQKSMSNFHCFPRCIFMHIHSLIIFIQC